MGCTILLYLTRGADLHFPNPRLYLTELLNCNILHTDATPNQNPIWAKCIFSPVFSCDKACVAHLFLQKSKDAWTSAQVNWRLWSISLFILTGKIWTSAVSAHKQVTCKANKKTNETLRGKNGHRQTEANPHLCRGKPLRSGCAAACCFCQTNKPRLQWDSS